MREEQFDAFASERNKRISEAVYAAICTILTEKDGDQGAEQWDEEALREITDYAAERLQCTLEDSGYGCCVPYYEGERPCYRIGECTNERCPFSMYREEEE